MTAEERGMRESLRLSISIARDWRHVYDAIWQSRTSGHGLLS